jgi:hypothetical protein
MLPPGLCLLWTRLKRHTAFALRSNSSDFEMTSLICSRGDLTAAAAASPLISARRDGRRVGDSAEARKRRRSAKGCR